MTRASVSELKAHLSRFLRTVKRGGEVQIVERGTPIATIRAIAQGENDDARRDRLIKAGILTPPREKPSNWILEQPPIRLPGPPSSELLRKEREDRV